MCLEMWDFVILSNEPFGLSLDEKILPEVLKEQGYVTRAIGKWHLGFFREEYSPTFRGFDSHYGTWVGHLDYWNHSQLQEVSSKRLFQNAKYCVL